MIDREILDCDSRINDIKKSIFDIREQMNAIYKKNERENDPEYIWKTWLPKVIADFDEFLKPYDWPIICTVNLFNIPVPIAKDAEKEYITYTEDKIAEEVVMMFRYPAPGISGFDIFKELEYNITLRVKKLNKKLIYPIPVTVIDYIIRKIQKIYMENGFTK